MVPRLLLLTVVAAIAAAGWFATWGMWRYDEAVRDLGPIETRQFEAPTLILLGTGGETENPSRLGPAIGFASGTTVVLADAGRGVAGTLRKAGIALAQPSSVYLTSLLPENTVGLDDLLTAGWRAGREHPLRLVGPPGTEALARGLEAAQAGATQALSERLGLHAEGARFLVQEIEGPWSGVEGGIAVEARPLSGGPLPSLGFRFEAAERSLVVAGADRDPEALADLARDASALVHGAVFSDSVRAAVEAGAEDAERIEREASLQISLRELAGAARQARVGQLVRVRLRPPPLFDFQFEQVVAERYDGRVSVARDGDELTL
jgi:ribonuclease BN (tRNA processing enzyme)